MRFFCVSIVLASVSRSAAFCARWASNEARAAPELSEIGGQHLLFTPAQRRIHVLRAKRFAGTGDKAPAFSRGQSRLAAKRLGAGGRKFRFRRRNIGLRGRPVELDQNVARLHGTAVDDVNCRDPAGLHRLDRP